MKQDHTKVFEWAAWANLDRKKNIELILLKGHLLLEVFMDNLLENGGLKNCLELPFAKKIHKLSDLKNANLGSVEVVQKHLVSINRIRNRLAHEWNFSVQSSGLERWSSDVLADFEAEKYSKYTRRTKIVHAFSALSGALVEIQK